MKKACMIVTVWFGNRSTRYNSPQRAPDQLDFFRDVFMEHAIKVDPGVDMDLVIVMNQCKKFPKGYAYVATLDGTDINRGKVRVLSRSNSSGKGFDGFAHGFATFQDEYDYFLFCEDDVVFFLDDYYRMGIETFEKNQPMAACVGYSPKSLPDCGHASHFGGGLLMSSREKLQTVAREWSISQGVRHWRLPRNEVGFTDAFHHCLDKARDWGTTQLEQPHLLWVEGLSPFARNWYHVSGQKLIYERIEGEGKKNHYGSLRAYRSKFNKDKTTCYFVGVERPLRKK